TSRPEDVRHFAFNDLLRKVKRDRVGWEHIRKNLLEHGPYLRMAFQWAVWRNEHRIVSIVSHNCLDITSPESVPVMEQRLFGLFIAGWAQYCLPNGFLPFCRCRSGTALRLPATASPSQQTPRVAWEQDSD